MKSTTKNNEKKHTQFVSQKHVSSITQPHTALCCNTRCFTNLVDFRPTSHIRSFHDSIKCITVEWILQKVFNFFVKLTNEVLPNRNGRLHSSCHCCVAVVGGDLVVVPRCGSKMGSRQTYLVWILILMDGRTDHAQLPTRKIQSWNGNGWQRATNEPHTHHPSSIIHYHPSPIINGLTIVVDGRLYRYYRGRITVWTTRHIDYL